MRLGTCSFAWGVAILFSSTAWAGETAAEKLRKALDRACDVEIHQQPLDEAVNQLREQTGINIVLDREVLRPQPITVPGTNAPINLLGYLHVKIQARIHHLPLRAALPKMLRDHGLTHALVGDTVLITTPEKAIERQLEQKVSLNIDNSPLRDELKRLSRETGANVVLDPRAAKEGQAALSMRLDEVPLETAVALLADEAGLSVVRLHNVLYVTSEARAEKLRKSREKKAAASSAGWRVYPDGKGGFRMLPTPATPLGGCIGGIGGLGGIGGIAGLGGGGFNQLGAQGGFQGMPRAPVPLTPPLPKKAKPAPPAKPKAETPPAPPAKPAATPAEKDKPVPKDKPQAKAIHPDPQSPRSRRKSPAPRT